MNILERRPDSYLTQFYYALEANDQQDLVQLIKYKGLSLTIIHVVLKILQCNNHLTCPGDVASTVRQ